MMQAIPTTRRQSRELKDARHVFVPTRRLALLSCTSVLALIVGAQAQTVLPQGGAVASGQVRIGAPLANTLTINQASAKAIVNWDSFSIGQGAAVNFIQPGTSAAILNRVTGQTASTIAGQVNANGQVFLVNPNGIAITPTGTVQVGGGFVASTLDIDNADFNAGRLTFSGKGSSAAVSSAGTIKGLSGSFIGLIGGQVSNSGTIIVPLGKVGLGAGEKATLNPTGDGFLQVALPTQSKTADGKALLDVSGQIRAAGGTVQISAAAAQQALHDVVNVSGDISARTVSGRSGNIMIGGGAGAVTVSGRLAAKGGPPDKGGSIQIGGAAINLRGALVDVSGGTGGGAVTIGGGAHGTPVPGVSTASTVTIDAGSTIKADALRTGDGGTVTIWSNDLTDFRGTISAQAFGLSGNGGSAEVSGGSLSYQGVTNLISAHGATGTLLLDPYNVTISTAADAGYSGWAATASGSNINTMTLQNALTSANVAVSTGASGAEAGNITVSSALSWSAANTLTLNAAGAIAINAPITATSGGLTLTAGSGQSVSATAAVNVGTFNLTQGNWVQNTASLPYFYAGNFTTGANASFLRASGGTGSTGSPYLLTDVYGLQGVGSSSTYRSASYKLANDIDASVTSGWNSGAGFAPIGVLGSSSYSGTFDGNNHAILNLSINRGSTYTGVGLFGYIDFGTVKNLTLLNANVTGSGNANFYSGAGLLAGVVDTGGTLTNDAVTGTLTVASGAVSNFGGLVGDLFGTVTNSSSGATVNSSGGATGVGGAIGSVEVNGATVSGVSFNGTVNATGSIIGGLAGYNSGSIANSYALGTLSVSNSSNVGGLIGYNDTGSPTLTKSYASVAISGTGNSNVGGLLGGNASTISGSYWNKSLLATGVGSGSATGASGLTTTQMKSSANFSGWDFVGTWYSNASGTYAPTLRAGTTILGGSGNLTISTSADSASNIKTTTLQNFLGAGTTLVNAASGTLTVNNAVTWSSANSLTLAAAATSGSSPAIKTSANITATGSGSIGLYGYNASTATSNNIYGVQVASGASVQTTTGALSITGQGGGSGASGYDYGAYVAGTLSSTTGAVTITGTGGDNGGSGDNNHGTYVAGSVTTSSGGTITLNGTGGTSTGGNDVGVSVIGGTVAGSGGLVKLMGIGGSGGGSNHGVLVDTSGLVSNTGSGGVTITGTGGTGSGGGHLGVILYDDISGATVQTASGPISITGTGGSGGSYNVGLYAGASGDLYKTTAGGTITLTGFGGTGPGGTNHGIESDGAIVTGSGGLITISGSAGSGGSYNYGVYLDYATAVTNTNSGGLTLTGTGGGGGAGDYNHGVLLGYDPTGATLQTAAGSISITGQGGGGGSGVGNNGVAFDYYGSITTTSGGNITIAGTGGASTGTGNCGLCLYGSVAGSGGAIAISGLAGNAGSDGVTMGGLRLAAGASAATLTGTSTSGYGVDIASGTNTLSASTGAITVSGVATNAAGTAITGAGGVTLSTSGAVTLTDGGSSVGTTALNLASNIANSSGVLTLGTANGAGAISGVISGAGALTKTGVNTLTLTGANTYTGGASLNAGILNVGSSGALGSSGIISFGGGTLQYSSANQTDYSGRFSSAGGQAWNIDTNGQNVTFATALTGASSLTKLGAGTLTLTGANTSWGATNVNGGTLYVGGGVGGSIYTNLNWNNVPVTIGSGATLKFDTWYWAGSLGQNSYSAGNLVINGGTLAYTGIGDTVGSGLSDNNNGRAFTIGAAGATLSSTASTPWNISYYSSNFALASNGGSLTFGGTGNFAVAKVIPGAGAVNITTTGTVTLDTWNTYTGGTNINAGTLNSGAWGSIGTSGTISFGGGTLQYSAADQTDYSSRFSSAGSQAWSIDTNGQNITFASALQGAGSGLTKSGTGTLTLSGANTFTGATAVNAGTLNLSGSWNVGAGTATTSVVSGATLSGAGVITAGTLSDSGAGTVNLTGSNAVAAIATSGTVGAFTFSDAAALSLGSINASGAIAISTSAGANLSVNNAAVLASSAGGNAITLVSASNLTIGSGATVSSASPVLAAAGAFINGSGSGAVSATSGRWLVYSSAPGADTFGSLNSGNTAIWNATYASLPPAGVSVSGNRYLFANQPTLTFISTSTSKTYGTDATAAVAASYSVSGAQNGVANAFQGDTAASAYAGAPLVTSAGSAASASVAGGPYAIAVAQGTLAATNGYALAFASPGTLTVNPASLTVTANSGQGKVYGSVDPALAYGYSGLVNGDTSSVFSGALTRAAGQNVGSYAIGQGSLSAGSNYTISYTGSNFAITPAALTVTANSGQGKVYGAADPTLTYGYSGLVNGDTSSVFSGNLTRAAGQNVGSYVIGQGSLAAGSNYTISYTGSNFAITPAALTVTANAGQGKVYGAADPTLTYGYSGLVNGDTSSVFSGNLTRAAGQNVGSYAIGQGSLSAGSNYTISYTGSNFAITPAALTVTANSGQGKVYGAADPTLTYGYSGLVNGDTSSVFSGNLTRAAGQNVGSYAIGQGSLSAGSNYTINYTGSNFAITPAALTVTANSGQGKVYGAIDPALTYGYSGLVNGDTSSVFSGNLTRAAGQNVGSYAIGQGSLSAGSNYTISYTGANFAITPAALAVMANSGQGKVYGAVDPALTYGYSGLVNGDTSSVFSGALTRAAGQNVGSYAIGQGSLSAGSNYTISYTGSNFAITPAALTVTANAGQGKVYGSVDPALIYGYSGLVNGDTSSVFSGSLTRAAGQNVGSYAIGQGSLSAGSNYTISYTGSNFAITPAALTVTANSGQGKVYGSADPTLAYGYSGLVNGDTSSVFSGNLTRAAGENVGSYAISQGSLSAGSNYTISYTGSNFAITPAALTVTANAGQGKVYGAADPTLTYGYSGLVNGDTSSVFSGNLARAAGQNVGSYAIGQGSLSAGSNYTISYTGSNFAITPAALTVSANAGQGKVYGAADPALAYGYSGLVNGDTSSVFSGNLTRAAGQNVGSYAIGQGSLSAGSNYTISYTGSNFAITPAALTVTANNGQGKVYGAVDPALAYGYSGLVNGDTSSVFSGSLTRAAGQNVGSYAIGQGSLSAGSNYTINYTGSNFAITPAALTVTASSGQGKVYGAVDPALAYGYSGLVNGDTSSVFSGNLTRAAGQNVGSYAIGQGSLSAGSNYTISYTGSNFAITPAALTVTANDSSKLVGTSDPVGFSGAIYNGLVNGDTPASLGALTISRSNGGVNAPGTYANVLQPGGLASSNYNISYVNGAFSIIPAAVLQVQVASNTSGYGSAPAYTVSGASYLDSNNNVVNLNNISVAGSAVTISDGVGGTVSFNLTPQNQLYSTSGNLKVGGYQLGASNVAITGSSFNQLVVSGSEQVLAKSVTPIVGGVGKTYDGTRNMTGLTLGANGLVGNDIVSVAGSGIYAQSNVGTSLGYTVSNLVLGGVDAGNYYLGAATYSGSNGSIAPKSVTLSASKSYDGTTSLAGAVTLGGLVNGETLSYVSATAHTANVASGNYISSITLANGTGLASNYQLSALNAVSAPVTINPAPVTVTALGGASTYGATPANPGLSASGLQNGETVAVLTGLANSFGISAASAAGSYTLSVIGTLINPNYVVSGTTRGLWTVIAASQPPSPSPAPVPPPAAVRVGNYWPSIEANVEGSINKLKKRPVLRLTIR